MPLDAAFLLAQGEAAKTLGLSSETTLISLFASTLGAIGLFLRWLIPKILEDNEKARKEERQDFITITANLTQTFEKRMEQADRTNERLMLKLEVMQAKLEQVEYRFNESHIFSQNNPPPSPPKPTS